MSVTRQHARCAFASTLARARASLSEARRAFLILRAAFRFHCAGGGSLIGASAAMALIYCGFNPEDGEVRVVILCTWLAVTWGAHARREIATPINRPTLDSPRLTREIDSCSICGGHVFRRSKARPSTLNHVPASARRGVEVVRERLLNCGSSCAVMAARTDG